MLKVMKYDWKNGWNQVRSALLGAAILSVLFGLCMGFLGGQVVFGTEGLGVAGEWSMDYAVMILSVIWLGVMVALLVLTVGAIWQNLSGRMFGPEGILTHTLPVDAWELLLGKAVGTWLFGVFMVGVALVSVLLVVLATAVSTGEILEIMKKLMQYLPKLGDYHFRQMVTGLGYFLYGLLAFLIGSFLMVVQLQFICIAARQFGRFRQAGGCAVLWALFALENNLNKVLSLGFLVVVLGAAACFFGSEWLLKHRLAVQ